mgnify:CR=1 FL=1
MNTVTLTGRLTRDPELRYSANGNAVCKFGLAVKRRFSRDEVDFFDCVTFNKTAETVAEHCQKGRLVGIEGWLQQNRWETNDGQKRSRVEVVADNVEFLDWPDSKGGGESEVPF